MEDTSENVPATPPEPPCNPGGNADMTAIRPDGMPVGRPFAPGGPPGPGRPRDPFAALIRDSTKDGVELVEFALACLRDDLDGRIADKAGMVDRMEADATVLDVRAANARSAGPVDVDELRKIADQAAELRTRAKSLRARLAKKRKIAVPVKARIAALEYLSNRGWGKPLERVDLSVGNPDGSPLGNAAAMPGPGALSSLTTGDLAEIGVVLERAAKRTTEPVP